MMVGKREVGLMIHDRILLSILSYVGELRHFGRVRLRVSVPRPD